MYQKFTNDGMGYDGFYGRGFEGRGCNALVHNAYCHRKPEPKPVKFLDTVNLEKFVVEFEGCGKVFDNCCEVPAKVRIEKPCLVIGAVTQCIESDIEYIFDVDRNEPIDWNAYQVFVKATPCGFHTRGAVGLEETKVTVPYDGIDNFRFTAENLAKFYRAKYFRDECDCEEARVPVPVEEFIEVDLDLRGNMATGANFFRGRHGNWNHFEHGRDKDRYVLYLNNCGRFVLERGICETRRFGDFR